MSRSSRWWRGASLALCVWLGAAGLAWAQAGTAAITGTVRDAQGAVLPGAAVTVTSTATGTTRTTVTNETGTYNISALPPGSYSVRIELPGFRVSQHENFLLRVDTTARHDATLDVGSVAETVTITGESPIINTTDASVGNVITQETIERLPVEARNVVHLLSLQPGATFIPFNANSDPEDPRYGAVAGARPDQQNVTLDGIDVNDPQLQTAYTSAVRMTQDALQEFRVSTTNYGAEAGRSSGPQVSLVTKSGTNQFAGGAYWFLRRTDQSTTPYFTKLTQVAAGQKPEPPKLDKDIGGGSFGGPIRRNRMFFFGNFEALREKSERPVTRAVPSDSLRDGVLMYRCADPGACPGGTVRGFSNTHTVAAGFYGLSPAQIAALDPLGIGPSRAASEYFKRYPSPNEPGSNPPNIMAFRFSAPIQNNFNTFVGRFDYRMATNHSFFARYNLQDDTINSAPQFPGQDPRSQQLVNNSGFAVGYDAALSSTLVNSFRYGMTGIDSQIKGRTTGNWVEFRFIDSFEPEGVTFTSTRETPTHNIVNDMSWLRGSHTLKFGGNVRLSRIPTTRDSGSYLSAIANGSWVAGVGRTFMPGGANCSTPGCSQVPAVASTFTASFGDPWIAVLGVISQSVLRANYDRQGNLLPVGTPIAREFATDEYEFYVQDSWRIGERLTLTGGLRYSLYAPPYEVNGLQVAPTISMGEWFRQREEGMKRGVPSNQSPIVTFDLAGPKNNRKGFYEWDKNNWAPRFAAAWTLTDKTVIRAGYSKVFDRIGQGIALNFDQGFAFGMATSINSPFGAPYETNPAVRFVDTKTIPTTIPTAPPGGFPQTPPIQAGIITQSIDDTLVTPSAHMANAIIGRELGNGFAIEGGYIGRFGRDLLIRRDIAMPLNLVDPRSGIDYFSAAQAVILATQAAGIPSGAPISAYAGLANHPYWENLFPDAAGSGLSATQAVARRFNRDAPDYITSLWLMDQFCSPGCSIFGPFAYFAEQYDSLAALSSIGRSNYHGMIVTLRKRYSQGIQFDFNYTMSESKDMGSNVERGSAFGNYGAGGYSGFLVNSWDPDSNYGRSDFDVRHQVNLNWVWDLPFGQGRAMGGGASGFVNQLIGDWSISGLTRWTSGFPFSVINCRSCWPTNWNLQGNAMPLNPGELPETGVFKNRIDGRPSVFEDPDAALSMFRFALPGEVGGRNNLRGDGYFNIDLSLSKAFRLGVADHRLRFQWDVFNVTNTPKFDVNSLTVYPDRSGFGRYDDTLSTCDAQAGRCMQFSLRYQF